MHGRWCLCPRPLHTRLHVRSLSDRSFSFSWFSTFADPWVMGVQQGCIGSGGGGGFPPPPSRAPSLCPATVALAPTSMAIQQAPASMALVTDSNRPQPLCQPPPTACPTASGAASEAPFVLVHPWHQGHPAPHFDRSGRQCPDCPGVQPLHLISCAVSDPLPQSFVGSSLIPRRCLERKKKYSCATFGPFLHQFLPRTPGAWGWLLEAMPGHGVRVRKASSASAPERSSRGPYVSHSCPRETKLLFLTMHCPPRCTALTT